MPNRCGMGRCSPCKHPIWISLPRLVHRLVPLLCEMVSEQARVQVYDSIYPCPPQLKNVMGNL